MTNMADFPGVAEAAAKEPPAADDAKPHAFAKVEHGKVAQARRCAKQCFGKGSGVGVVFHENIGVQGFAKCFGAEVFPDGQGGRPDAGHAFGGKRAGHDDADAEQFAGGVLRDALLFVAQGVDAALRRKVFHGYSFFVNGIATKIERHAHNAVDADFKAERMCAFGVEGELQGRLAAPAAQAPHVENEFLGEQGVENIGNRRCGEAGHGGEFFASELAVLAQEVENDFAVVVATAGGVVANVALGAFVVFHRLLHIFLR